MAPFTSGLWSISAAAAASGSDGGDGAAGGGGLRYKVGNTGLRISSVCVCVCACTCACACACAYMYCACMCTAVFTAAGAPQVVNRAFVRAGFELTSQRKGTVRDRRERRRVVARRGSGCVISLVVCCPNRRDGRQG